MIRNLRKSSNFTYVRHVRVFPDSRLARPPMAGADCRQEFNAEGFALSQERQPPLSSFSWLGAFDIIADACAAQAILRGTVATINAIGWILPGLSCCFIGDIGFFLHWVAPSKAPFRKSGARSSGGRRMGGAALGPLRPSPVRIQPTSSERSGGLRQMPAARASRAGPRRQALRSGCDEGPQPPARPGWR